MAETLEEKVNKPAEGHDLENKIDNVPKKDKEEEKKGFFRKAFDLMYLTGAAIGTTALSSAFVGSTGFFIGGALAGGGLIGSMIKKGKSMYEMVTDSLKTYSALNMIISPIVYLGNATFPIAGALGGKVAGVVGEMVSRTAYAVTAYNTLFTVKLRAAYHLVGNYLSPKGITKSVKKDLWPFLKRSGLGLSSGYHLLANGVPSMLGVPSMAYSVLPFAAYNAAYPI